MMFPISRPRSFLSCSSALSMLLSFFFLAALPAASQSSMAGRPEGRWGPPEAPPHPSDPTIPMVDASGTPDQRMLMMVNAARQKSITSAADKLLKLARELNDEVTAAKSGPLTPSELHKVQKIEKLARSVRSDMSDTPTMVLPPIETLPPVNHR